MVKVLLGNKSHGLGNKEYIKTRYPSDQFGPGCKTKTMYIPTSSMTEEVRHETRVELSLYMHIYKMV